MEIKRTDTEIEGNRRDGNALTDRNGSITIRKNKYQGHQQK